jgi:hypothetical protein
MRIPKPSPFPHYLLASLLCFVVATNGSEILANILQTQTGFTSALRDSIRASISTPIGSLLLAAPFLVIGIVAANLAKSVGAIQAIIYFVLSVTALGAIYLAGYWSAQQALLAGKLTAAAISVGMLPFQSILILVLGAFPAGFIFWKAERAKT